MQAIAIGLSKLNGKAKSTGNPFEMHKLTILVASENVSSAAFNKFSLGYEAMDLDVDLAAFPKFAQLTYPCSMNIEIDQLPRGGKLQAMVVGFTGQPAYIDVKPAAKAAA